MNDVEKVGERIRAIRLLMRETQEEFAEHCDLSSETVSLIERGKFLPRLETLQNISKYTQVSVGSLFNSYFYVTEKEIKINEYGKEYTCYGIKVYENSQVLKSMSDVFPDETIAKDFADMCNRSQLNPIHLEDVIEDYL